MHTHTDTHTPSRQGQAPRGQLVPGACACASNPSPEARAPSCWVTEKHVWGGHRQSPLVAGGCGSHRAGILEDADPRASLTEVPIRQSLGICILTAQGARAASRGLWSGTAAEPCRGSSRQKPGDPRCEIPPPGQKTGVSEHLRGPASPGGHLICLRHNPSSETGGPWRGLRVPRTHAGVLPAVAKVGTFSTTRASTPGRLHGAGS